MPRPPKSAAKNQDPTATIGFDAKLWLAADKLRNNMDAAEYKHVVLCLIFFKYISDTFEEHRAKLLTGEGDYAGANPEDPDEDKAEYVFWVPADARWSHLQASAEQPTIGKTVDGAMVAFERDNPRLIGILPKDYARPGPAIARRDSPLPMRSHTAEPERSDEQPPPRRTHRAHRHHQPYCRQRGREDPPLRQSARILGNTSRNKLIIVAGC